MDSHFDAEELIEMIKKKPLNVSRATAYRTLDILCKSNILKKIKFNENYSRYELTVDTPHHDHLVCVKCKKIIEFKDDEIEKLQRKICNQYNFKQKDHKLMIFGICGECREKKQHET